MGVEDDPSVLIEMPKSLVVIAEHLAGQTPTGSVPRILESRLIEGLDSDLRDIGRETVLAAVEVDHQRTVAFWNTVFDKLEEANKDN